MSRWVEFNKYPEEPKTAFSGRNWRYTGEVTLSMALGDSGSGHPMFEVTRICEDAESVRIFAIPQDIERGLEQVSSGTSHIAEPYWYGYHPRQVRGYCRENRLPEPEGYAKAWRQMRQALRQRRP